MAAVRVLRSTMDRSGSHPGAFAIVQAAAIDDTRMKPAALRMLLALGIYRDTEGWCWPKQRQLAARLGITQQAVSKALRDLAEWGYVEIHDQYDGVTGARISSRYRVVMDFVLPLDYRRTPQPDVVGSQLEIVGPTTPEVVTPTTPEVVAIEQPRVTTQENNPSGSTTTSLKTPPDQAQILRALSDGAQEVIDWWRQCHGRKRPPRLNPTQARLLEEAVSDLGVARLKESVQYMAGKGVSEIDKARTAAYTKRRQDESGTSKPTPRSNGSGPMPGAASKQRSSWSDSKFRVKRLVAEGYDGNA